MRSVRFLPMLVFCLWPIAAQASPGDLASAATAPKTRVVNFDSRNLFKTFQVDGKSIRYQETDAQLRKLISDDPQALKLLRLYSAQRGWGGVLVWTGAILGTGSVIGLASLNSTYTYFWPALAAFSGTALGGIALMLGGVHMKEKSATSYIQAIEALDHKPRLSFWVLPNAAGLNGSIRF
ncbi:MAG: hypothetical protein J0L75_00480 [Spirochaetes bacterium]|nr:hypothetical protein [Spirochaetota bacterium]